MALTQDLATVESRLEALRPAYPHAVAALMALMRIHPTYTPIATASLRRDRQYWADAESRCLEILYFCGGDEGRFRDSVREWVRFSFEFLRKQQKFLTSGHYAVSDFQEIQTNLYENDERMEKFYLIALMFSFLFSSNYIHFFEFFRKEMLPRVAGARTVCDVGCGHGVYLAQMLLASPASQGTGLDISPASLAMTRRMLEYHVIPASRFHLTSGDLHGTLPLGDETQDAVTCFEVIEHLEHPAHALGELRRLLAPGGALCLSTAIRMESVDHIHLFQDPQEVRELLSSAGLTIEADEVIPLTTEDLEDSTTRERLIADPSTALGYIAMLTRGQGPESA